MKPCSPAVAIGLLIAFLGGFVSHVLYQRWNPSFPATAANPGKDSEFGPGVEPPSFRVTFSPHRLPKSRPIFR
jgi:hypothetical protein